MVIADPHQAEAIVAEGRADCVALAPAFDDPRWAWHAAEELGARSRLPPQYQRPPQTMARRRTGPPPDREQR